MRQGDVFQNSLNEFFLKFKIPFNPAAPSFEEIELCSELISEESDELLDELEELKKAVIFDSPYEQLQVKVRVLKEAVDTLYVIYYLAKKLGLPIMEGFNLVHASNLSKLDDNGEPILREDGKILKGPNYKPADLSSLLKNSS